MRIAFFVSLLSCCLFSPARAETLTVPGDFPTIQEAIDAAVDGDIVEVSPGTYPGPILVSGKDVRIRSVSGPAVTTIQGATGSSAVVGFVAGVGSFGGLEGFTVTGGTRTGVVVAASDATILGNVITGNSSNLRGGGVDVIGGAPTIELNTISLNSTSSFSGQGGGMTIRELSAATVRDNVIEFNTANGFGGGISIQNPFGALVIESNEIRNNTAGDGAGIGIRSTTGAVIRLNRIVGNSTAGSSGEGGGIGLIDESVVTTIGNILWDNTAAFGGAIGVSGRGVLLSIHNTIVANQATSEAGAIMARPMGRVTVQNSIVRDNSAPLDPEIRAEGIVSARASNIAGGYPGPDNFDLDPLFLDAPNGDFHLEPGSPCIDAGWNAPIALTDLDPDGDPRLLAFGLDVGADEAPAPTEVDCNCNGISDDLDLTLGYSTDVDTNGIPDECALDCDGNLLSDPCSIAQGEVEDCNGNGIPDPCDPDLDLDGVPDDCEVERRVPLDHATIQEAIEAANDGDTVLVAPGLYPENLDLLGKRITLRSELGPDSTVIDGSALTLGPHQTSTVSCLGGEPLGTRIEGFRIQGGIGTSFLYSNNHAGAGLLAVFAHLEIVNCVITGEGAQYGCGAYLQQSSIVIRDSVFVDNVALSGGGIYATECLDLTVLDSVFQTNESPSPSISSGAAGIELQLSVATIEGCQFLENFASGDGGGIGVSNGSEVVVRDCEFGSNYASGSAAAMLVRTGTEALVENCSFHDHYTITGGRGALSVQGGTATVRNCEFENNISEGGALSMFEGVLTVESSLFVGNASLFDGGAVRLDSDASATFRFCRFEGNQCNFNGGAIELDGDSQLVLEHCVLTQNTAERDGGAIYCVGNLAFTGINNLFSENHALEAGGAIVAAANGTVDLSHLTIVGNTAGEAIGGFVGGAGNPVLRSSILFGNQQPQPGSQLPLSYAISNVIVENCMVDDGSMGPGFINADPLFVSGPDGDYYLSQTDAGQAVTSPAVDFGPADAATLGLDMLTTRTDEEFDTGLVDLGYHYGFEDCDGNSVPDSQQPDADRDGVPDDCDVCPGGDDTIDCDQNGVPDACDLLDGVEDCNENGVPDHCEIQNPSVDCDGNGILDTCESLVDCDGNGIPDTCEMLDNPSLDCDGSGVLDSCELAEGALGDCDGNGIPDTCEMLDDPTLDCDGSGVLDSCELATGTLEDCNANGVPDSCDLNSGTAEDCNGNGVPDSCDLLGGEDCNGNGILDSCEVDNDCDGDGVLDDCQIVIDGGVDCNDNLIPDACDIASGFSTDLDLDGIPDECTRFFRGDLDGGQNLGLEDVILSLDLLFGSGTVGCADAVDVNDDGALDIADPLYLLSYLYSGGGAPPPPAACGTDLTSDSLNCEDSPCP